MEHKTEGAACLITRSAITKVFSAGLNLKFLLKIKDIKEEKVKYLSTYQALLSKLLKLPMITVVPFLSIRSLQSMDMLMLLV